jgi:hypothetical protein
MYAVFFRTLLMLVGFLLATPSLADRVQIPLALDAPFIEMVLRERAFADDGRLRVNDDGSGCQYLQLSEPRVRTSGGRILVRTSAQARAGRALGDRCLLVLDWRGELEFVQQPVVEAGAESVLLRTTSWRALRADGSTDTVSTTVGRWIEQFLPADLKQTRISFAEPMRQLEDFLALVVTPNDAQRTGVLLDTLAIDAVAVGDDHTTVTLGVDVTPASAPPQPVEPVLNAAELARLEQQLDAIDAFFTYTIKSIGGGPEAGKDAVALLDVLLELRQQLVAVLTEPQGHPEDPARALFVNAWEDLVPILYRVAAQQPDPQSVVHYLTFIGAGDALEALDDLGPALGIEISSDGLRRLARMLVPDATGDPLQRDDAVDALLRTTLGFGEPLPPPHSYDDTTWVDAWLALFVPHAMAADRLDPSVVKKLNNWVPGTKDIDVYLPMVRDVLRHVVAEQLRSTDLDGSFSELFRWLVFAAAWQESCWRQFVAKNDMRVPVESGSGDLGVMQINPTVWRGLYDLHGLRWDIVYNARAGADILEHYLINYALRHREHETTGVVDNLARSTYATYNGGPRQYDRYRRAGASANETKVDTLFYDKYREVKSGKDLAVTACYTGS